MMTLAGGASAQYGLLFGVESFQTTDMYSLSRYDYSLGTARSSAMGGAFTSLGADLASATINPAGLAMYRGGEFSISPSIVSNHDLSWSKQGLPYQGDNFHNKFTLNSFGLTFNTWQGSGTVTSRQIAFGYNRLADFNTSAAIATPTDLNSIASLFATQLNDDRGVPIDDIASPARPFETNGIDGRLWGAALAYKTQLIDHDNQGYFVNDNTILGPNALKSHYANMDSDGSAGEYYLAGAINFSNKFYVGYTLSIYSVRREQYLRYEEKYMNNSPCELTWMQYNQLLRYSGVGVGLKVGVVWRPTDDLRIGAAFHTPQYMSVNRRYEADMYTEFIDNSTGDLKTNTLEYEYDYTTPPRVLLGASYTFGGKAVVSLDYEAVWYNGMRSTDKDRNVRLDQKSLVKADFKRADNLRAGVEFKPLPMLAVRAGFAWMGSALRVKDGVFDYPAPKNSYTASLGLGWRSLGGTSLDFTYALGRTKFSNYDLYYYKYSNADIIQAPSDPSRPSEQTDGISSCRNRNLFTLTFGQRF